MPHRRGLTGSVRGMPCRSVQVPSRSVCVAAGRASLPPGGLTPCPSPPKVDRPSWAIVRRPRLLKAMEHVLGAVGRPQREEVMIIVLEGPAATHGDEPRIPDFGEDHQSAQSTLLLPPGDDTGDIMKLLLTSAGIKNASIRDTLLELLGKPIAESTALCIPTASYAQPMQGPERAWVFISGQEPRTPMVELGWKSVGNLELTALPSIPKDSWVPLVQETDVLLVNGGDPMYLSYWMHESGLADLLPSLSNTVYVGLSAGSLVMAPSIGADFVRWKPPTGGDETLGMVDFSIFPHLDHPMLPENTMADAEKWAAGMSVPCYAIDDETAVTVVDGAVEVVSEGHWKLFTPGQAAW